MAGWPTDGQTPWGDDLKSYVDGADSAVLTAANDYADTGLATKANKPSGAPDGTKFFADDGTWKKPPNYNNTYFPKSLPSSGYSLAAPYSPGLNVFNLKPSHLVKTRTQMELARKGTGYWRLGFLGDSTVAGFGSTSADVDSMPATLRQMLLNTGMVSNGTGVIPAYANLSATDQGHDSRVSYSGSNWVGFHSGNSNARIYTGSTGQTLTFTAPAGGGDLIRIFYDQRGGNFSYAVDGGSSTSVTTTGAASMGTVSISGLSSAAHTVVITPSTNATILGFERLPSGMSGGLRIFNAGISGATTTQFSTTDWADATPFMGTSGFQADTVVIQLMENDINNGTAHGTWKTNLQSIISAVRSGGADVIVLTSYCVMLSNSGSVPNFIADLYDLAVSMDFPVLDMWDRWGATAGASAISGLLYNSTHPNPAGYADTAQALFNLLVGGGNFASVQPTFVGASITTSSAQAIPSGTQTAMSCPSLNFDTVGMFASATPTRLTVPPGMGGYYRVTLIATATAAVGSSSTRCNLTLTFNGAGQSSYATEMAGGVFVGVTVTGLLRMNPGDYVGGLMYQNSGSSANFNFVMSLERIGY